MKKIYFYNRKYPEYKIEEIKIIEEEYLVRKKWKCLNGIIAKYDISCLRIDEMEHFISLYQPYEDKEIYIHDTTFGNELAFSFNYKFLLQWQKEDINFTIEKLKKRIEKLKVANDEAD